MVRRIKPKKPKERFLIETMVNSTHGWSYCVILKKGDKEEVYKDWYGDYPSSEHANEAGRNWVFNDYKEKNG